MRSTKTLTIPYVLKTYKINQKTTRCVWRMPILVCCYTYIVNSRSVQNTHTIYTYIFINWRKFEMCVCASIAPSASRRAPHSWWYIMRRCGRNHQVLGVNQTKFICRTLAAAFQLFRYMGK